MVARARQEDVPEDEQICPLCINELDETERAWLPCSCGYQLCLFCYDRLKTEFSNQCPNCRVEYDSDFQAGLRRRQERVAQLQKEETAQREAAAKAAATSKQQAQAQAPPPPPPRAVRSPRSPRRDLHIEQEQLWPSLGAATTQQAQQAQLQQQHAALQNRLQQQQPQQLQHPQPPPQPGDGASSQRQGSPLQALPVPRLAPILPALVHPPVAEAEASSSSSADTAATTPQSPASSVVSFRAAQPGCGGTGGFGCLPGPSSSLLAASTLPSAPAVHGRCAVMLQPSNSGLGVEPDPEGASLAVSLQEAVRAGSLSVKQAAATLASYLRQRQHAAAAAAFAATAASSASDSSSPARAGQGHGGAGSTGGTPARAVLGLTPFTAPASGAAAGSCLGPNPGLLAPSSSSLSVATSASLSHWASGTPSPCSSLPMPVALPSPLEALTGGSSGPWQQQQQQQLACSPVRDNDKLPLFMRRGTLRAEATLAGGGGGSSGGSGSPSSAASQASSSGGSGSFPGFPSRSGSPTQELKRIIAPPPGFGPPLAATGIAALPRFR